MNRQQKETDLTHPAYDHFPRMWAERNNENVVVFADGTVFDRAARRECVRANIRAMRADRAHRAHT